MWTYVTCCEGASIWKVAEKIKKKASMILLRCRHWAQAPVTENLYVLVLAELCKVLPGVCLWNVPKWDYESQTQATPHSSATRLKNILFSDVVSSKVVFSFYIKVVTQASKLAVPWQSVTQILGRRKDEYSVFSGLFWGSLFSPLLSISS